MKKIEEIKTLAELKERIQNKNGKAVLSLGRFGNASSFTEFLEKTGDEKNAVFVNYSARFGTHTVVRFLKNGDTK